MALLYGRGGRLTSQNGGFRPGQGVPGWIVVLIVVGTILLVGVTLK
jgi:hypothetical protein